MAYFSSPIGEDEDQDFDDRSAGERAWEDDGVEI